MGSVTGKVDAFVSYNSKDAEYACRLKKQLAKLGVRVWVFDAEDLADASDSHEWQAQMQEGAPSFISLWGPHGLGPEQRRELNSAVAMHDRRGLAIIPILIPGYAASAGTAFQRHIANNFKPRDMLYTGAINGLASTLKAKLIPPKMTYRHRITPARRSTRIIAVSGGSGAGAWKLCRALTRSLCDRLGMGTCKILSMDRYYKVSPTTRSQVSRVDFGKANFDDPDVIDFGHLVDDIGTLTNGGPIQIPRYDKASHSTVGFHTFTPPTQLLVIEGTYLLQDERIREISDATIYVDVHPEIRFLRRFWKDVDGFRVKPKPALTYYVDVVRPAFERWVQPFQEKATWQISLKPHQKRFSIPRKRFDLDFSSGAREVTKFLSGERLVAKNAAGRPK